MNPSRSAPRAAIEVAFACFALAAAAAAGGVPFATTAPPDLAPSTSSARADAPVELLLRDGSRRAGLDLVIDPAKGATLARREGGALDVALDDLVEVWLRPASRLPAQKSEASTTLLLHDGSRLVGAVADGGEESLRFELVAGGVIELPLDAIHGLLCGPRHADLDLAQLRSVDKGDVLHRRVEVGGDFTRGTVVSITRSGVRFEYSLGTSDFPYAGLEAVVLEQQVAPEAPKGRVAEVDLVPDGTLLVSLERLTPTSLVVRPAASGASLTLPRDAVSAVRLRGPGVEWLSARAPASVKQTPWLGSEADFLYPWRRDRTVTGRPLRIAGWRYGRGIGCHARTELTWEHDGAPARLLLDVGLSDEVLALPDRGAVEFRVLVDGAERWKSPLVRGGDGALHVGPIALDGAKQVTLVADFGAGDDVADRAIFAEPLLLR